LRGGSPALQEQLRILSSWEVIHRSNDSQTHSHVSEQRLPTTLQGSGKDKAPTNTEHAFYPKHYELMESSFKDLIFAIKIFPKVH